MEWIGEIPTHWHLTLIKRFCKLQTGTTPSTAEREWFDGDLPWFTPGDFSETFLLIDSSRTLSQKAKTDNVATIVADETVMVVGIGATAGKVGFTTTESSFNQQITALCADKDYIYSK